MKIVEGIVKDIKKILDSKTEKYIEKLRQR
jgi:hypothetical protein